MEVQESGTSVEPDALPIDIQLHKALAWMVDRQRLPEDWDKRLKVVRSRIDAALEDVPEFKGGVVDYSFSVKVLELLKKSEGSKKTFFGRFSSKKVQEWEEIVKQYQADNIYVGEMIRTMVHNVKFEITAIKKAIAQSQQYMSELDRREISVKHNITALEGAFRAACSKLGIEGVDLRAELVNKTGELKGVFEDADALCRDGQFQQVVDCFAEFRRALGAKGGDGLDLARFVATHGNERVGAYLGLCETGLPDPQESAAESTATAGAIEIDWGDMGGGDGGDAPAIDWGADDGAGAGGDGPTIDWGADDDAGAGGDGPTIDWGGDEDGGADGPAIDWGGDEDTAGTTPAAAKDPDFDPQSTERIFASEKYRSLLLDELAMLQTFLMERLHELSARDGADILSTVASETEDAQAQSPKKLEALLKTTNDVIAKLDGPDTRLLLQLKSTPGALDRQVAALAQKRTAQDKLRASLDAMDAKRKQLQQEIVDAQPALDKVIAKTKELQQQTTSAISKMYSNRVVHILGEINTL